MSGFDPLALAAEFPALAQMVHGDKRLVYLDNAATTQKPRRVLDALMDYYRRDNANVHRAVHTLSQRATNSFEAARETMRRFIGAASVNEIVFTRGTTEALNLVARSWGGANLGPGDEVVVSGMEHHSNIVPWQLVCEATGATLRVMRMDADGAIADGMIEATIGERTKVVSVVHISNALGTINPLAEIIARAKAHGAIVVVDGAQAAPHQAIDVGALGCDFFALSGHKMYGPTGIGVLWGRYELLAAMPPWQGGGDMIKSVSFERTTYAEPPSRFEAGTPHIAGAVGLGAAAEFLLDVGLDDIAAYEATLLAYGTEKLSAIDGVRLIGTAPDKAGVLSFVVDGVHPHDIGTLLDHEGVAVRTGHHCAEPVMAHFSVPATTRASLGLYNTIADLDALVSALGKAVALFR